jgi:hypothetical protein
MPRFLVLEGADETLSRFLKYGFRWRSLGALMPGVVTGRPMVSIQPGGLVCGYRQHTYDWSQLAVVIHDLGCQQRKTLQVQGGLLAGALVAVGLALALLVVLVGRHGRGLSGSAGDEADGR